MAGNTLMSLLVKLGVDSGPLDKGLASAEKTSIKSMTGIAGGIARGVGTGLAVVAGLATAAAGIAVTAGTMLVKSSLAAASESEQAFANLNATLISTKYAAGMSAEELTKMATALQSVTRFDDEAIMGGQAMLLTFTKIGKKVFPDATEAMLNMAEKFGGIDAASVQLGKALNDPILGVTALRRVGVMLSAEQEKQIKKFMKMGDIVSAQKIILGELTTEFGGLAKAMGATASGKMAQIKNAWGDVLETIGGMMGPLVTKVLGGVAVMVQNLAVSFGPGGSMRAVFSSLIAFVTPLVDAFVGFVQSIDFNAIGNGIMLFLINMRKGIKEGAVYWQNVLLPAVMVATNWIKTNVGPVLTELARLLGTVLYTATKTLTDIWNNQLSPFLIWAAPYIKDVFSWAVAKLANDFRNVAIAIGWVKAQLSGLTIPGWLVSILTAGMLNQSISVPGKAAGGSASGLTMVGERGPELVNLPAGSYVNKASDTQRMLGNSGGGQVNFYFQFGDAVTEKRAQELIRMNADSLKRAFAAALEGA
jgi:hypothetical protein